MLSIARGLVCTHQRHNRQQIQSERAPFSHDSLADRVFENDNVSSRLHSSPLYTRKSLNQMLLTYNSERRNYVTLVTEVMRQLTVVKSELEAQQAAIAAAEQPSSKPKPGAAGLEIGLLSVQNIPNDL
jgi:hypothetical protein